MSKTIIKDRTCCVCGGIATNTIKAPSGTTLNYCDNCAINNLENYEEMVSLGMFFDEFSRSYREKTALPSLSYYKKTIDVFDKDVLTSIKQIIEKEKRDELNDD